MGPTLFPLRWESTGDQWWFASPIDCAAANGHYDIVRELLHIDPNLLIKLTSLRRIRRLETVWDDGGDDFSGMAKCRSQVAQKLLRECEAKNGHNSLIGAGYGGWLLYTAASAGDLAFVGELLTRDPLLVFGEGEYGVTDMFYAAARSRNRDVFAMLFDCSMSPRGLNEAAGVFRSEMVNRAVHAAAGGGSVAALTSFLEDGSDILGYRDREGSTVLHTASGRGRAEVVSHLISSVTGIINSVDNSGNTALHVAAYYGHLPILNLLVSASPSSSLLTNKHGNTFLHMAISGFLSPSFRRLDRQTELVRQIIHGDSFTNLNIEDIINLKNNYGRTALHMAISDSVQSEIIELLMSARFVNLNISDEDGHTPLDLLRQRPQSEILIDRMISAGGVSEFSRSVIRRKRDVGDGGGSTTPGTSFGIPDSEILLYAGVEDLGCDLMGSEYGSNSPMKGATRCLRNVLRWPGKRDKSYNHDLEDKCSVDSYRAGFSGSLREQFSRRTMLSGGDLPSSSAKKKFIRGLTQGVLQVFPRSPASAISGSSWSSPVSTDRQKENVDSPKMKGKQGSFNLRLMNSYLCFGAQRLGQLAPQDKLRNNRL